MFRHDSSVPLYVQIEGYIRQQIAAGVYPVNSRIPSERQLAEEFDVSRLTVSKALKELVREGLLQTRVGKGTFVCHAKIAQQLTTLTSFTEEMSQRGKIASSCVLFAGIVTADEDTARALNIGQDAQVVMLKRVRLANRIAMATEISSIVAAICPNILDGHDFAQESLYQVLREEFKVLMTRAHQTMEARLPTPEEYQALNIDRQTPILGITRITYNHQNQPFEYVKSAYRGDRYRFQAELRHIG